MGIIHRRDRKLNETAQQFIQLLQSQSASAENAAPLPEFVESNGLSERSSRDGHGSELRERFAVNAERYMRWKTTIQQVAPIMGPPPKQGLYDPAFEHDSCGVGFVAHIKGKRSHQILIDAEEVLRNMDHRGACGCEPNTGDGAGILTALPHEFLQRVVKQELNATLPPPGQFAAGNVFLPRDAAERDEVQRSGRRDHRRPRTNIGRLAIGAHAD